MVRAIIFDCFGVLISDALRVTVEEVRLHDPQKADRIVATIAAANKGIITADVSRATVAAELGLTVGEYVRHIRQGEVKNRELLAYIAQLRGHYKTALLSNVMSTGLDRRFTPGELAAHFATVVVSGDIGYAKPELQAYEITAERLGVRLDECIMIDDIETYCQGAKSVGMQAIQYHTFAQMKQELEALLA